MAREMSPLLGCKGSGIIVASQGRLGGCIRGGIRSSTSGYGVFVLTLDKIHIKYAPLGLHPFFRTTVWEACEHKESDLKPQPHAKANARTTAIRNS